MSFWWRCKRSPPAKWYALLRNHQQKPSRWQMNFREPLSGLGVLAKRVFFLAAFLAICAFVSSAPARAAHEAKGQTFDGPGGKLYYEVTGSGPGTPLVVVNGGPGFDHAYPQTPTACHTLGKN